MISQFNLPVRLVFGAGGIDQVGKEAKALGNKAMIVTYPDIRRVGILDKALVSLKKEGVEAQVFEELEPNPRCETIDKGAGIVRDSKIKLIIGLGGGSVMDASKAIAAASGGKAPIWDYMLGKAQVQGDIPAIIQVPTFAGTGSELNPIFVITEWQTHEKRFIAHPAVWAKVAIVDPGLTVSVPKKLTASGGVDAFSHIMEPYLMPDVNFPINDAIREAVMRTIVTFLPKALDKPDDIEARTQLSWASTIASCEWSRLGGSGGTLACHSIEHAVSGYYDVNHGAGLAAILPAWMRHMRTVRKERAELFAKNVFSKTDGVAAFEEWLEKVGMRLRLRDLGCELDKADEIAAIAVRTWEGIEKFPGNLNAQTIARIYREAY